MPAKRSAASPAVIPVIPGLAVPSNSAAASIVVSGSSDALVVPGGDPPSVPIDAGAAAMIADIDAHTRAARVAGLVKAGIASKLAERERLAALEKATREAVNETSEINAAIEAGIVEVDRC